jgi:hypothetical protein
MSGGDDYFGYSSTNNSYLAGFQEVDEYGGYNPYIYHFMPGQVPTLPSGNPTADYTSTKNVYGNDDPDNQGLVRPEIAKTADSQDTVEAIHHRIVDNLSTEGLYNAWSNWLGVINVLDNLRAAVLTEAQKLGETWKSQAANAFFTAGPGGTLKSIDDWTKAAWRNIYGISALIDTISTWQYQADQTFLEYKTAIANFDTMIQNLKPGISQSDHVDLLRQWTWSYDAPDDLPSAGGYKYTVKMRSIQFSLAQSISDITMNQVIGGYAGIYEGPHDAIQADPAKVMALALGLGGLPGGVPNIAPPAAPNVAPNITAPTVPNVTNAANVPTAPPPDLSGLPNPNDVTATNVNAPNVSAPNITAPNVNPADLGGGAPFVDPALIAATTALTGPALLTQGPGALPNGPAGLSNLTAGASGAPNVGGPPNLSNGVLGKMGPAGTIPPAAPGMSKFTKGTLSRSGPPQGAETANGEGTGPAGLGPGRKNNTPAVTPPAAPAVDVEAFNETTPGTPAPPVLRNPSLSGTGFGRPPGRGGATLRGDGTLRGNGTGGADANPMSPAGPNRRRQGGGPEDRTPDVPVEDEFLNPTRPPTAAPVLRNTARSASTSAAEEGPSSGRVLRGVLRGAAADRPGADARRKADHRTAERERVDREYERIRALLEHDDTWQVDTPGGPVVDNTATRRPAGQDPTATLGGAT